MSMIVYSKDGKIIPSVSILMFDCVCTCNCVEQPMSIPLRRYVFQFIWLGSQVLLLFIC
jgi:hypothetical protein